MAPVDNSLIGGVHSLLESAGGSCRDIKRAESAESTIPDTLALSRDYETSNSPDPQDGRAEVSCPAFKRAESAESAESAGPIRITAEALKMTMATDSRDGGRRDRGG